MTIYVSSRAFNQDSGSAKRAATKEPVVITDRGQPSHVLLSYVAYTSLLGTQPSLADTLAQRELPVADDFEPVRMDGYSFRPADFSR